MQQYWFLEFDTILPKYRNIDTISIFCKSYVAYTIPGEGGGGSAVMYRLCVQLILSAGVKLLVWGIIYKTA